MTKGNSGKGYVVREWAFGDVPSDLSLLASEGAGGITGFCCRVGDGL